MSESLYLDSPLSNLIISGDLNPNSIHKLLNGKNHVPFKSSLERLLKEGKIGVEQFMSHERSP